MKIEQLPDETEIVEQETENGDVSREMAAVVEGGYKKENPPHDDCCPICFGSFHFPCRTSCGHWFCSNCILQYWGYTTLYFKKCKCPMCGSFISKLLPHATIDEQKVLEEVEYYNHLNGGGIRGFFREAFAIPSWTFVRRRYRETRDRKLLRPWNKIIRLIMRELAILYVGFGFKFFPGGYWGIITLMELIILALELFFYWDARRYRQELERRERLLEVDADVNHLD